MINLKHIFDIKSPMFPHFITKTCFPFITEKERCVSKSSVRGTYLAPSSPTEDLNNNIKALKSIGGNERPLVNKQKHYNH